MFFEEHFEASTLESKIQSGSTSLVDILNDENILQEVSAGNTVVLDFLTSQGLQLIKHALSVPADTSGHNDVCLQAHQVLAVGNETLLQNLSTLPGAFDEIFKVIANFTSSKGAVPPTMLHFISLAVSMITKQPNAVMAHIKKSPQVLSHLLQYLTVSGVDNLLVQLFLQSADFTSWCVSTGKFTECLLACLCIPTTSIDAQVNAMNLIKACTDVPQTNQNVDCVAPFVQSIVNSTFLGNLVGQGLVTRGDNPIYVDKAVDLIQHLLDSRFKSQRMVQSIAVAGSWLKTVLAPPKTASADKGAGVVRVQGFTLAACAVEGGVPEIVTDNELDIIAVQCLQKYPKNNILHCAISRMLVAFVTKAPPEKFRAMVQRCRLVQWLAQNDIANVQRRSAFGGHAIEIMQAILAALPATGISEDTIQGLVEYKNGVYSKTLNTQRQPLCGVNPASCKNIPQTHSLPDGDPDEFSVATLHAAGNSVAPDLPWTTFSAPPHEAAAFIAQLSAATEVPIASFDTPPQQQPSPAPAPPAVPVVKSTTPTFTSGGIDDLFGSTPVAQPPAQQPPQQQTPPVFTPTAPTTNPTSNNNLFDDFFASTKPIPPVAPAATTIPSFGTATTPAAWDPFGSTATPTPPIPSSQPAPATNLFADNLFGPPATFGGSTNTVGGGFTTTTTTPPPSTNTASPSGWVTF
eukprot:PhF_6_TR31859/c1_g1_i3/m.47261